LSIILSMASTARGCGVLCDTFENEIWSILLYVGLDNDEASFVRCLAFTTITRILQMLPKVNSASPITGVTFLGLVSRMQQLNFYQGIGRCLENYVYCEMPHDETRAVVTPRFVSALCEFLSTLLQVAEQDTIIGFSNSGLGQILVQLLNVKLIPLSTKSIRPSLLAQAASTVQLLTFAHHSTSSAINHLPLALSLFSVEFGNDASVVYELEVCYEVAANFVLVVLESTDRETLEQVMGVCENHFSSLIKVLIHYGRNIFKVNSRLTSSLLRAYILILAKYPNGPSSSLTRTMEEHLPNLTSFLISIFEQLLLKTSSLQVDQFRGLVGCALQATFGVSNAAILEANKNGVGERLVDELARVQIKIALNKPKNLIDTSDGQLLLIIFGIFRNYFNKSLGTNQQISKTDFVVVCGRLWPFALSNEKLVRSLLQMLLNFTNGSSEACSVISTKPIMNAIIKQFNHFRGQIKVKIKTSSIFALNFNLLSNMAISSECRAHYWKVNLLGSFMESCDSGLHSNRSRQQSVSLKFWLKFILALSYYPDGQENILRIRDVLDYFCDVFTAYPEEEQTILIIIHNLAFTPQSRVRIAQHSRVLACLKKTLTLGEKVDNQRIAASSCWGLMTSSQKAKGRLKSTGFPERLEAILKYHREEEENIPLYHLEAAFELLNS